MHYMFDVFFMTFDVCCIVGDNQRHSTDVSIVVSAVILT